MWPEEIHRELSGAGVRVVGYVPDAGHKRLIELCQADKKMRAVVLTTEEEGIGLAAGAWLGGQKSVLLMQSSGVGNVTASRRRASAPPRCTARRTARSTPPSWWCRRPHARAGRGTRGDPAAARAPRRLWGEA